MTVARLVARSVLVHAPTGAVMNLPAKPSVLFVYYTHTQQSLRVCDAMAEVLRARLHTQPRHKRSDGT